MTDYPEHPAAALLPMLADDELHRLADDIRANGLREPITLYQGQVLDGRNRVAACKLTEVAPRYRELDGEVGDPIAYVLSANLHRRHLTTGQRAMVAVDLLPVLEQQARARQGTRTDLRADSPRSPGGQRAREQAAAAVGISPRSVADAKRLTVESPELTAQVRAGTSSLHAALGRLPGAKLGIGYKAAAAAEDLLSLEDEAARLAWDRAERIRESWQKAAFHFEQWDKEMVLAHLHRLWERQGYPDFRSWAYANHQGEYLFGSLLAFRECGFEPAPWIAAELGMGPAKAGVDRRVLALPHLQD
jgi:hypothetical protein